MAQRRIEYLPDVFVTHMDAAVGKRMNLPDHAITIGLAAAILLGLYFITRLVVATAVVNATLWERRNSSAL